ncbi:MAG TPA: zf-HC2 domain-containing protein [Verrucomicrobiae bacterium]|nr:zf-HC2 domain-containing protein [Verrucomicrobiae bacterium]
MNCREAEALLGAYVDEELDLARALDVESHARECQARAAVAAHAPYYTMPAGLLQRVERRAAKHFGIVGKRADSRSWPLRWMALAAVCAAIAILVLRTAPSPLTGGSGDLAREVVDAHVRSLLADHLMDVVSSDRHTVKPWFAGKLDFAPEVRDLAAAGFTLAGGRLDYLHGRTAAARGNARRVPCRELDSRRQELVGGVGSRCGRAGEAASRFDVISG